MIPLNKIGILIQVQKNNVIIDFGTGIKLSLPKQEAIYFGECLLKRAAEINELPNITADKK